jgi:D-alanine--poly(phosphoribitol) ligase subunit 2
VSEPASLEGEVRRLFREVLALDVPSADTDLIESGLLDSLALVEMLFELEQRFGVELALEELDVDSFRTTGRIAALVAEGGGETVRGAAQ